MVPENQPNPESVENILYQRYKYCFVLEVDHPYQAPSNIQFPQVTIGLYMCIIIAYWRSSRDILFQKNDYNRLRMATCWNVNIFS